MRNAFFATFFILILTLSKLALATSIPGCVSTQTKNQGKNIILPGVDQPRTTQIYFLHNISSKSLWIDHPLEGKQSAKAGWASFVQPGKWSALILNRKDFVISCAIIEPGKVNYQECAKAVAVCTPEKTTFDSKRKGSYWLAEDKTYEDLLKALEQRGVKSQLITAAKEKEAKRLKDEAKKAEAVEASKQAPVHEKKSKAAESKHVLDD
jgi:hypothetical protein